MAPVSTTVHSCSSPQDVSERGALGASPVCAMATATACLGSGAQIICALLMSAPPSLLGAQGEAPPTTP